MLGLSDFLMHDHSRYSHIIATNRLCAWDSFGIWFGTDLTCSTEIVRLKSGCLWCFFNVHALSSTESRAWILKSCRFIWIIICKGIRHLGTPPTSQCSQWHLFFVWLRAFWYARNADKMLQPLQCFTTAAMLGLLCGSEARTEAVH